MMIIIMSVLTMHVMIFMSSALERMAINGSTEEWNKKKANPCVLTQDSWVPIVSQSGDHHHRRGSWKGFLRENGDYDELKLQSIVSDRQERWKSAPVVHLGLLFLPKEGATDDHDDGLSAAHNMIILT